MTSREKMFCLVKNYNSQSPIPSHLVLSKSIIDAKKELIQFMRWLGDIQV